MITLTIRTGMDVADLSRATGIIDHALGLDPQLPVNVVLVHERIEPEDRNEIAAKLYAKYPKSNIRVDISRR